MEEVLSSPIFIQDNNINSNSNTNVNTNNPIDNSVNANHNNDLNNNFNDCVDKILDRINTIESTQLLLQNNNNNLLSNELSELSYLCTITIFEQQQQSNEQNIILMSTNLSNNSPKKQQLKQSPNNKKNQNNNNQHNFDHTLLFQLNIEIDTITILIELLEKHVKTALNINLLENAMNILTNNDNNTSHNNNEFDKWLRPGGMGNEKLDLLRMGLEAASIIMFFACCTVISTNNSSCVNEDAMEASIALYRIHLTKHLIPSLNQTGHLVVASTTTNKSPKTINNSNTKRRRSTADKLSNDDTTMSEGYDDIPDNIPTSPSRQIKQINSNKKLNPSLLRDIKKLYIRIHDSTIKLQLVLMERIQMLVQRIPLDDQQIILLATGSLSALEIDCYVAATNITSITGVICYNNGSKSNSTYSSATSPSITSAQQLQISSILLITLIFQKYINHRDVILEDLFPLMLKLPSYKRSLRSYPIRYSSALAPNLLQSVNTKLILQQAPHSIQMITALILSLIQSCVTRPTYEYEKINLANENNDEDDNENGNNISKQVKTQKTLKLLSGLNSCWTIIDTLIGQLLSRCSIGKGDCASEFRPFLVHFVEDLLLVLIIPEYPVAEHILLSIQRRLNNDIMQSSPMYCTNKNKAQQPVETTYINLAFDILARINTLQASIFALQRKKPLKVNTTKCTVIPEKLVLSDYCENNQTKNVFMLSCDYCHKFFHGVTVGIHNDESVPDEWFCDSCRLGKIALREQRKYGGNSIIDDNYIVHHAYMVCLAHRFGVNDMEDSIRFHIGRWIDEIGQLNHLDVIKKKVVTNLLQHWDTMPVGGELLTEEGSIRILLAQLAQTSPLLKSFRTEISFLIKIMSDESVTSMGGTQSLRKLSLKTIEKIVEGDPDLMLSSIITKAVSNRLRDESISVREAAVSLVGAYVVYSPAVANAFHSSLLSCLYDVGVSVRKRCIRIFQSILLSSNTNKTYEGRSVVCDTMLQLAANPKEEDGVRDLIHELFFNLWLVNGNDIITTNNNQSTIISPSPVSTSSDAITPDENDDGHTTLVRHAIKHQNEGASSPSDNIAVTPSEDNNNNNNSNNLARRRLPERLRRRADIAAEQMMEVVRTGGTGDYLHALLVDLLLGDASSDDDKNEIGSPENKRKRRKSAATIAASKKRAKLQIVGQKQQECIQLLVDSLFELLVSIEEKRTTQQSDSIGKDIAATLQTIDVFAKVVPTSIARHIDTLLPYMKADNGVSMEDESSIVGATCDILYRLCSAVAYSTSNVTKYNYTNMTDRITNNGTVANDLVEITYKFGSSTLNSAVRTLSVLMSIQQEIDTDNISAKILLKLSKTFYKFLHKNISIEDFSKTDFKIQSGTHRGLTVLGLICQYHDDSLSSEEWETEVDTDTPSLLSPKEVDWSNINIACYRLFSKYLQKNDSVTKCKAMEAFGGLFLAQPRLVLQLEKIGLISDVMSEKAVLSLQLEALDCWKKILLSEEQRIDGGEADAKMDSDGKITVCKKISGDQDGDATLFGGVLTNHAERLFEMTHSIYPNLRFSALELLGLLLRQGLVNPNEAVPHLFALQGDIENLPIRSMALRLMITEGEKRPDILRQRICAGVKQAYQLQRSIYNDKMEVSAVVTTSKRGGFGRGAVSVDCIFSGVFKECIMTNRKQRQGLYKNLLGLFETDDTSNDEIMAVPGRSRSSNSKNQKHHHLAPKDVALLSFAAQVLAHLPYNIVSDPLYIVYNIGSIITLQGPQTLDRFASFLRPYGLSGEDDLDENNLSEDALERVAMTKFPSRSNEAKPLSSKEFDMIGFINLCREGASLCLLLRLKTFLCTSYNLTYTRCMEYDPNAKERISDKGMPKVNMPKPFDASIPSVLLLSSTTSNAINAIDKDSLIRQYSEFRRLMREEHSFEPDIESGNSDNDNNDEDDEDDENNAANSDSDQPEEEEEIEIVPVPPKKKRSRKSRS